VGGLSDSFVPRNSQLLLAANRQAVKKLTQKEKQFEYLSEKNFIQPILRDSF